ncbi:MAG: DUF3106 domain-containing protein [Burkholderiaceae bacterium]|jgi:hypothetical protein
MNRVPLHSRRPAGTTAVAGVLGLCVVAALVGWLWRPSKTMPGVPAPLAASAPVAPAPASAPDNPAQARRQLALSGRWARLSGRDQAILAPLREDWPELSADQRQKWLDLALRFPSLQVDEQQRIQDRMRQWALLSPAERGAARLNFQEIRQLSAQDRLEQWEAYRGLAPSERKELAVKAQSAGQSPAVPRRADPSAPVPKSSGVAAEAVAGSGLVARPVGGTVVQAPIGATTQLVSQLPPTPGPAPAGPKIAAQPGMVDPATLLPQARLARSPQPPAGAAAEGTPSNEESSPGGSAANPAPTNAPAPAQSPTAAPVPTAPAPAPVPSTSGAQ